MALKRIAVIPGLCVFLALFLVTGTLADSSAPAAPKPTTKLHVLDNFNNNRLDSSKWVVFQAGIGPSIAETNKRVEISLPSASTGDSDLRLFGGGIISRCRLSGDFDVQVDYILPVWPYANGVQ